MKVFIKNNNNIDYIKEALKLVKMWEEQQLFSRNFIDTLNQMLNTRVLRKIFHLIIILGVEGWGEVLEEEWRGGNIEEKVAWYWHEVY